MSARESSPKQRSETSAQTPVKEVIRNRMKMVIDQLESILQELKEVAKELKEVVKQIDRLTSDFDFEMEPDDWTIATISSTSSSDTARNHDKYGLLSDYGQLGFLTPDILSDSWEFCSFLELPAESSKVEVGGDDKEARPTPSEPDYRMMNGGLIPNGPKGCAPDSSSEETISSAPSHKTLPRTSGTRERVRFSDKVLYHALCCDDDDDDDDGGGEREEQTSAATSSAATTTNDGHERASGATPKASSVSRPRHHCQQPAVIAKGNPTTRKKIMRNNSTQTVSHKSTQTVLSYGSSKTQQNSKKGEAK